MESELGSKSEATCLRVAWCDHAIARFNLSFAAEEEAEFRTALNGRRWRSVCEDLAEGLRAHLKYHEPDELTPGYEAVQELLFNALREWDLNLHDE